MEWSEVYLAPLQTIPLTSFAKLPHKTKGPGFPLLSKVLTQRSPSSPLLSPLIRCCVMMIRMPHLNGGRGAAVLCGEGVALHDLGQRGVEHKAQPLQGPILVVVLLNATATVHWGW
jgi:hypothetical protein